MTAATWTERTQAAASHRVWLSHPHRGRQSGSTSHQAPCSNICQRERQGERERERESVRSQRERQCSAAQHSTLWNREQGERQQTNTLAC